MNKIYNKQDFKPISFNTNYSIDKYGNIYSNYTKGFLKWSYDKDGYPRVDIYKEGKQRHFKVHRLVWLAWQGDIPSGYQINHKDDNKSNPCLMNLYLGTQKENISDCVLNNHRVGHVWSLCLYDREIKKVITFCPAYKFIDYSGHSNKGRGVKKLFCKNWFKSRYDIIYYKQIESVTTMGDECSPVE